MDVRHGIARYRIGRTTGPPGGGVSVESRWLDYCLTAREHSQFEREGYFIIPGALPASLVRDLADVVDRLDRQHRQANGIDDRETIHILDFIGRDDLFLRLLDWPPTFPKVWGILGWNIQLYHTDMIITPPRRVQTPRANRLEWHQDSGRLNLELEGDPRPRVSLKIGFFLTDTTEPGCGNFTIVPGSHRRNRLNLPDDGVSDPLDALTVCVPPGTAVFFDRRLWHSGSPNDSDRTRKVLFYGYSYRWLRPRDDMTVDHLMERCDPIRRQLLGASTGGMGYTSPGPEDVPLKAWMEEHLPPEEVPV